MGYRRIGYVLIGAVLLLLLLPPFLSKHPNNPYPAKDSLEPIYYSSFSSEPNHLDPAMSYSSNEYRFICQIYEPIVQYHYLKRPYELVPLTCEKVPVAQNFDKDGKPLPAGAPVEQIARVTYEIKLKKGILYQKHPCFAKNAQGELRYHNLTDEDLSDIWFIRDFEIEDSDTRELVAKDYVYQIKRLCLPNLPRPCPIRGILGQYIDGMRGYAKKLRGTLKAVRAKRKKAAGALYNQDSDERNNPIVLDLDEHPFPGVEVVDKYTYRIHLTKSYPQILYWMAMPFFAPVPEEATDFFAQGAMLRKNFTLDRCPVGTGAFRFDEYNPHQRITLVRNENYHLEKYPATGDTGDKEAGMLDDAGQRLPLLDKVVYTREKESVPLWIKFLQGYYESSGISGDNFDKAINMSSADSAGANLSEYLSDLGITLKTSKATSTFYYAFNMTDKLVGGLDKKKCKLRQAIAIAMDMNEYIQIFNNGRGIVSHNPIPEGIFGFESGKEGMNPYVFDWDEKAGKARRKSIDEAKKLLAEAGYPGGKHAETQKQLVIRFETVGAAGENNERQRWIKKQFTKIGILMETRATDYNTFQDKIQNGNYQMVAWGWNADYPDPENFLFLLYGPNSRVKHHGENVANYDNPEYNALFKKMSRMGNTPERAKIIHDMVRLLQHDTPWFSMMQPVGFGLYHSWIKNHKVNLMANNNLKYLRINAEPRTRYRNKYNVPNYLPVYLVLGFIFLCAIPPLLTRILREET